MNAYIPSIGSILRNRPQRLARSRHDLWTEQSLEAAIHIVTAMGGVK